MPNIQLSANLRYLRQLHNLTQDDLSIVLSISRQAYCHYENSRRTPDLDSLIRLANLYKLTLDQLVNHPLSNTFSVIKEEKVPYNMALNVTNGNTIYLSEEETNLITGFRSLSDNNKQILKGFISSNI